MSFDKFPQPPPILRLPSFERGVSFIYEAPDPPQLIRYKSSIFEDNNNNPPGSFIYEYPQPQMLKSNSLYVLDPPPPLMQLRSRKSINESQPEVKEEESIPVEKKQKAKVPKIKKKITQIEQQPCFCSKSGCLKRYCRCFHSGRMCFKECQCAEGCLNNESHQEERQKAISHVNEKCHRNKNVPKSALFKLKESFGCNCKNTRCQKGYCECFLRKQQCTVDCQCENCENGQDEAFMQSQQNRKSYRTGRRIKNK